MTLHLDHSYWTIDLAFAIPPDVADVLPDLELIHLGVTAGGLEDVDL